MKQFIILSIGLFMVGFAYADDLDVLPDQIDGVSVDRMMTQYWRGLTYEAFDRREENYEALKTKEQLLAHQTRMRNFFLEQIGGQPERTPLNTRITGRLQKDGFSVEKVILRKPSKPFRDRRALPS